MRAAWPDVAAAATLAVDRWCASVDFEAEPTATDELANAAVLALQILDPHSAPFTVGALADAVLRFLDEKPSAK